MRRMFLFIVGAGLIAGNAIAQLAVQVRVPHPNFLVYESIPITVSVQNFSGRPIQLEDTGDTRWLKLIVTDENHTLVPITSALTASEPLTLAPGKVISQTIDLLPMFALRSRGTYQIQVNVRGPAVTVSSTPVQFTLIYGREIWTQTVGLPVGDNEYRTYTLVTRRDGGDEFLFAGVREEPAKATYSLVPLGLFLSAGPPQTKLDKNGHLHVLYQSAPRSFSYAEIDPAAKASGRAAFSDFITRPELVDKDGVVSVVGGEQTYPKSEHILSEGELHPPPAEMPVKPKPKK